MPVAAGVFVNHAKSGQELLGGEGGGGDGGGCGGDGGNGGGDGESDGGGDGEEGGPGGTRLLRPLHHASAKPIAGPSQQSRTDSQKAA